MTTLLDILSAILYFIVSLLIVTIIGIVYIFAVVVILIDELITYIRHKL